MDREGGNDEERERRRGSDFLVQTDSEGRVIDLYAFRMTLGARLALAGVAPQLAQKIMRHADCRTTRKHYTVPGLPDTAAAMNRPGSISNPAGRGTERGSRSA